MRSYLQLISTSNSTVISAEVSAFSNYCFRACQMQQILPGNHGNSPIQNIIVGSITLIDRNI